MSVARLQLEQLLRDDEQRAEEVRAELTSADPELERGPRLSPHVWDAAARLVAKWWNGRGRGRVTRTEVAHLVRKLRAHGGKGGRFRNSK